MRKVFYDNDLQKQFDRNGYVIIDLFDAEQTQAFIKLYNDLDGVNGTANTNKNTYELSFFEKDIATKKKKFTSIYQFVKPLLDKVVINYSPIIINLFNKVPGTGEVPIHQNWTFVDEKEYTSVSVWCPLQEVNHNNGTLEVVPGTHKVISDYRGPSIPWVFDDLNELLKEKYMVPLNLRPGQVGIIDDSLIHYSAVNNSSNERKAVQLILKPEEVPTIHCFKRSPESNEIQIIDVEDDYFFNFNMWEIPQGGKNERVVDFEIKKIKEEELVHRFNKNLTIAH